MKTITIEIPEGYDLIQDGDVYRLVATPWPQQGDEYEFIDYYGRVKASVYDVGFDSVLKEKGNFFEPGTAKDSALYEVMNGKYYYWWKGLPEPSKVPESLEYFAFDGWNKGYSFCTTLLHRWLKKEGL